MSNAIETRILPVDPAHPDPATIDMAAAVIRAGGLVAFPTETVYGLGANALDPVAARRIFAAKERPSSDPLIVHIADMEQLAQVAAAVPELARRLTARFWPGPLTLVLPRQAVVPNDVTAGGESVAVRMPSHPVALALIRAARTPIAAPSANRFSRPSPTTAQHVLDDLHGRVEIVLDGGPTEIGLESTVLSLLGKTPLVLRPGGLSLEELREVVPDVAMRQLTRNVEASGEVLASPGMLTKHYAPRVPLLVFTGALPRVQQRLRAAAQQYVHDGKQVGALLPEDEQGTFGELPVQVVGLGASTDLAAVGARLFAGLRELERRDVDIILTHSFSSSGRGLAIWDRMLRASEGRIIDVDNEGERS
jgi:L-threonylcarbamoyladenylate synthase